MRFYVVTTCRDCTYVDDMGCWDGHPHIIDEDEHPYGTKYFDTWEEADDAGWEYTADCGPWEYTVEEEK